MSPLNELKAISKSLLDLHKALLQLQKGIHESQIGRSLQPQEVLNLLFSHADFMWLRTLSVEIVRIDEMLDDKEASIEQTQKIVVSDLQGIFNDPTQYDEFKRRLGALLGSSPDLRTQLAEFKKQLSNLLQ